MHPTGHHVDATPMLPKRSCDRSGGRRPRYHCVRQNVTRRMNGLAHPGVVLALATAIALSGCGKISAAMSPASERITKAFPLSDETTLAIAR